MSRTYSDTGTRCTKAEQIHQCELTCSACVERRLGRLVVSDDQLLECAALATNDLRRRHMCADTLDDEVTVELTDLGMVSNRQEPLALCSTGQFGEVLMIFECESANTILGRLVRTHTRINERRRMTVQITMWLTT